jgi:hypothetical protein
MAKRTLNRKELRAEYEAAEAAEASETTEKPAGRKRKPGAPKAPRKPRSKAVVDVRMKLYWGVFNQSLKQVALYEFDQKKDADKKAEELSKSGRSPHFVQKVKEAIQG